MSGYLWRARVYWEDTDGGGIVYYANYLRFLERARTEWLRSLGHAQSELMREQGIVFAVLGLDIQYRRPARLDDELTISCMAQRDGGATLSFDQQIYRRTPEDLVAEARVRVACLDARTLRPTRLPAFITEEILAT